MADSLTPKKPEQYGIGEQTWGCGDRRWLGNGSAAVGINSVLHPIAFV
jgi:hypothetical protein